MDREELKRNLKQQIVKQLNLEEVQPESIQDDAALFGDGLGLDSIDALELIVLLDRHYGIKITDPKDGRTIFASVNTMADHILAQKAVAG